MLLSHLLVEFDASLAGRICESESIVFKHVSSFSKYNYSGRGWQSPTLIMLWCASDVTHVINYTRPSTTLTKGVSSPVGTRGHATSYYMR